MANLSSGEEQDAYLLPHCDNPDPELNLCYSNHLHLGLSNIDNWGACGDVGSSCFIIQSSEGKTPFRQGIEF
jgi:hypothetical protein